MSKVDIGVGDEFPLDASQDEGRHHGHWRGHGHHRHHGNHHHRGHGLGRFAVLLILAGIAGLIVTQRFTAELGYGLIGAGAALLVLTPLLRAVLHWRHHRRISQRVS